jgi:hypothetical protein
MSPYGAHDVPTVDASTVLRVALPVPYVQAASGTAIADTAVTRAILLRLNKVVLLKLHCMGRVMVCVALRAT